ncbi:hypothetical protein [Rhodococcus sp. NPDC060176]|uniref:hypothetical protein n=1 Tax=Rhodococcus sp. NPDC060176 TaxID=3347062 RepID=UPI003655603F
MSNTENNQTAATFQVPTYAVYRLPSDEHAINEPDELSVEISILSEKTRNRAIEIRLQNERLLNTAVDSTSTGLYGMNASMYPEEARRLAKVLNDAADEVDAAFGESDTLFSR